MLDRIHQKISISAKLFGSLMVDSFHFLALFVIGGTIVWSAVLAYTDMITRGHSTIDDILLLFIYLELGAMVGIYFKTNHMPVRFLIYVAITALTRMMIQHIQHNHTPDQGILLISGAILILTLATLVIRYGSSRFPYGKSSEEDLGSGDM